MGNRHKHPLIRLLGIILLTLVVLVVGFVVYIQTYKTQFISHLEAWYNQNHDHELHVADVSLSITKHFPHIHLAFEKGSIQMMDTLLNKQTEISFDRLGTRVNLGNFLKKELQFEHIELQGITYHSAILEGKPLSFYENLPQKVKKETRLPLMDVLNHSHTQILVKDSRLLITDAVKNKRYDIPIDEVRILANLEDGLANGQIYIDAQLDALGFNLDKGTFGNGAQVIIDTDFEMDANSGILHLEEHPMRIDEQVFQTDISLYFEDTTRYHFQFENTTVNFSAAKDLLSQALQEKLKLLTISKPLYANINLAGRFAYKDNPIIDIQFNLDNNHLTLNQKIALSDLSLSGSLTNRKQSYSPGEPVQLKDLSIQVPNLQAQYERIPFVVENILYQTSDKSIGQLSMQLAIQGDPSNITSSLTNINYNLSGGSIQMNTTIDGNYNDLSEIIESLHIQLLLEKTMLQHQISGYGLPLQRLNIDIQDNVGQIEELRFSLIEDEVNFTGTVTQISDFLKSSDQKNISSKLSLTAEAIHIDNLLDQLQGMQSRKKTTKQAQRHLREIVADIEANFAPDLQVSIDKLYYGNWEIDSLRTGLAIDEVEQILLDSTSFRYGDINTMIVGQVELPSPDPATGKNPMQVNFELISSGGLDNFNQLFGSPDFEFRKGQFDFDARLVGLASSIDDLKRLASGHLHLSHAQVQLSSLDKVYDIPNLDLEIQEENALLKDLTLALTSGDAIHLSGKLDQFGNLITPSQEPMDASLTLRSSHVHFDELITLFIPPDVDTTKVESKPILETIETLQQTFNPKVEVRLDSVIYAGQLLRNVRSGLMIDHNHTLILDSTHFEYLQSSLDLLAELKLMENHNLRNPYSFDMKLELNAFGQTRDFNPIFNDPDFEYEAGTYYISASIEGIADSLKGIPELLKMEFVFEDILIRHLSDDALMPIDKLQVGLDGHNARLDSLIIPIEDEKLFLSGTFDHFPDLMNIPCGGHLKTSLDIYSDTLTVDKLVRFFRLDEEQDSVTAEQSPHAIRSVMASTLKKYNPSIYLKFDEVFHKNLNVSDIQAFGQWIDSTSTISLEDVAIHYQQPDGYILTDFSFTLAQPDTTPFTFGLACKAFDFQQFLENSHLIGIQTIDVPGEVNGLADFQIKLSGSFDDDDEIIYNLLDGDFVIHVYDASLVDFRPIIDNMKILKPERFADIRFAPIDIHTRIEDGRLFLDRTEIKSNAFQVFAEGELLGDSLEAWVAIPLSNIKKQNLNELPQRTGFYLSGNKIYLALEPDKHGKLDTKIRLSNKKWYKRRGLLEEYRSERKAGRKEKKAYKKE